jgi:hypothetical protein
MVWIGHVSPRFFVAQVQNAGIVVLVIQSTMLVLMVPELDIVPELVDTTGLQLHFGIQPAHTVWHLGQIHGSILHQPKYFTVAPV